MKKNYLSSFVTGIFTIISTITFAQNIGINTNSPDAAAALDVRSASGKKQGVLFPTVALTATGDAATITTPPTGLIVWNDGTGGLSPAGYYYNSGTAGAPSWTKVANGAVMTTTLTNGKIWIGNASNIATEQTMSGDVTMTNVGVTTIGNDKVTSAKILDGTIATVDVASNAIDGTKIDIASTTNGSLMYYNGTDWVNLAPGTAGQILKTNGAAAPTWVDANTTLTKKDIVPNTSSVVIVSNGTGQVVGASNVTVDVQGTAGGVLYGKGAGTAAAFNAAGTTGQMLESGVAGAPTWIDKSAILKSQNGLTTVTTGGSATATSPYVELGGSLYKATTVTQAANTLAFTSTATNGFSVDGTTFSVDAANDRVGIGTAAPGVKLEVNSGGGTNTSLKCEHTGSNFIVRPVSSGGNSTVVENTGGGAIAINPNGGNVGIGTTTINEKLTIAGNASISDANTLEFGKNVSGKEANAGKIGYQTFTTGALDIVGAGTSSSNRMVKLWDNVTVSGLAGTGNRLVYADASGLLKSDIPTYNIASSLHPSNDDITGWNTIRSACADDAVGTINFGFNFKINGINYSSGWISTNGILGFGSSSTTAYTNTNLPASVSTDPMCFFHWDDDGSNLQRYVVLGTSPNQICYIHSRQSENTGCSSGASQVDVYITLHETSNVMSVRYVAIGSNADTQGANATYGFQFAGGSSAYAVPLGYNTKLLDDNNGNQSWSIDFGK